MFARVDVPLLQWVMGGVTTIYCMIHGKLGRTKNIIQADDFKENIICKGEDL